jgi:hypothetical protein
LRVILASSRSVRRTGSQVFSRDPGAFTDKITASKKLRKYLDIEEAATCRRCKFRESCKLRDIEPESKVTSSADVLRVAYMMVRQADYLEKHPLVEHGGKTSGKTAGSDKSSEGMTPQDEEELIRMESERQMKEFSKVTKIQEHAPEVTETAEEELALYIAGIKLLDGLELIVPKTLDQKKDVLEMLEASIQEFTNKRKVDTLLRLQKSLDRTCSKSKVKRNPSKGIHELIDISGKNLEQFAKSPSGSEVKH